MFDELINIILFDMFQFEARVASFTSSTAVKEELLGSDLLL